MEEIESKTEEIKSVFAKTKDLLLSLVPAREPHLKRPDTPAATRFKNVLVVGGTREERAKYLTERLELVRAESGKAIVYGKDRFQGMYDRETDLRFICEPMRKRVADLYDEQHNLYQIEGWLSSSCSLIDQMETRRLKRNGIRRAEGYAAKKRSGFIFLPALDTQAASEITRKSISILELGAFEERSCDTYVHYILEDLEFFHFYNIVWLLSHGLTEQKLDGLRKRYGRSGVLFPETPRERTADLIATAATVQDAVDRYHCGTIIAGLFDEIVDLSQQQAATKSEKARAENPPPASTANDPIIINEGDHEFISNQTADTWHQETREWFWVKSNAVVIPIGKTVFAAFVPVLDKKGDEVVAEIKARPQVVVEETEEFTFEDIFDLDARSIQFIIRELSNDTLTLALVASSEELREKVYSNISTRAAEMIQDDLMMMGPVDPAHIDKARQEILKIVRKLEEEGRVVIPENLCRG